MAAVVADHHGDVEDATLRARCHLRRGLPSSNAVRYQDRRGINPIRRVAREGRPGAVARFVDGYWRRHSILFVRPVVAHCGTSWARWRIPGWIPRPRLPPISSIMIAALVSRDGSLCRARSYERSAASNAANRRTMYVPSRFRWCAVEILSRRRIFLEDVWRRGDRSPQPVDCGTCGPEFAPDLHDMFVPVKSTVRHVRRLS